MDILNKDGVNIFVGREDPSNPPVFVKSPHMRYCPKCKFEADNSHTECPKCQSQYGDGKMQCPVCYKFFDYLVGENFANGRQGCESCWRPPVRPER